MIKIIDRENSRHRYHPWILKAFKEETVPDLPKLLRNVEEEEIFSNSLKLAFLIQNLTKILEENYWSIFLMNVDANPLQMLVNQIQEHLWKA